MARKSIELLIIKLENMPFHHIFKSLAWDKTN